MEKDKFYIYANDFALNNVIVVYNNGIVDKEVTLSELLETYKVYHSITYKLEYLKQVVGDCKDNLDKLEIEGDKNEN